MQVNWIYLGAAPPGRPMHVERIITVLVKEEL
jgi:hypothetical protein